MNEKLIGSTISALRIKSGYSQKNIADFLNIDQSMISKIESNSRTISSEMLEKLSCLFGVPVEMILEGKINNRKLSFAFRASDISLDDMNAISSINKIALNIDFMEKVLGEKND